MNHTIIIAEAGVNHNGSIDIARQLIDAAADAGVDYVKFQTFKAKNLVSKDLKKADYQKTNTGNDDSQYDMLKKLELSNDEHDILIEYCKTKGVKFFSTAFDLESLQYLKSIGLELVKIPSGEITNLPYLELAARLFNKVILSTGMATMAEIKEAIAIFEKGGITKNNITILHCNSEYPTPMQDVNLKAMLHIASEMGTSIGYSDHTLGIEVPIAAVALGASVIEKHFTIDRTLPGPDHKASLNPGDLKSMASAIRNIEKAIGGSGIKEPSPSEIKNMAVVRKSIVASKEIKKGEVFSEENITTKRPGTGMSPMKWNDIIGKIANKNYKTDELIEE